MRGVEIKEDGRAIVFGAFLKQLIAVQQFYQDRSERLVAFVGERFGKGQLVEATVSRVPQLFDVKLRISEAGPYEYAREEIT